MVSQVPQHTSTHASSPQSSNTDQMPEHYFHSCCCKTTNSCRQSVDICWELLHCSSHELGRFLFVLPNSIQTWQTYEMVQKEFFLACFPQGNEGCQAKSINSHAKMIKRIVLACCAQAGNCPIYSYCLAFISALLHFWPVQYMTWESFRRSCTCWHSKSGLFVSGIIHHYWRTLWCRESLPQTFWFVHKRLWIICYLLKQNLSLQMCTHTK